MKNKKNLIIGISIFISLIIILSIIFICFRNKKENNTLLKNLTPEISENVDSLVNEMSAINDKLIDNLTADGNYNIPDTDVACVNYGGDAKEIIDNIKKLYSNSFAPDSMFKIVTSTYADGATEEKLYVCMQDGCEIGKLKNYKIKEETITDDSFEIEINSSQIVRAIKKDNVWKLDKPIIICQYKEQ